MKKQCSNCYWWDAAPAAAGEPFHECHNTDKRAAVKASMNWHTFATQPHQRCTYFRAISPDDPATLWNRRHPGHKERKPKDPEAVKRGKAAKRKGKRGEDEWAEHVVEQIGGNQIWEHGDRDPQWENNALAGVRNEVKRYARFGFTKHCRQVMAKAATRGLLRWIVAWRPDCKPGEYVHWYVTTHADDYLADMAELRDLRTIVDALKLEGRMKDVGV